MHDIIEIYDSIKQFKIFGEIMEFKIVNTVCPYCGVGCGLGLVVRDNKVVGVYPNKRHPINEGKLCAKGNYCYQFIHSKDRLTKPLIKKKVVLLKLLGIRR